MLNTISRIAVYTGCLVFCIACWYGVIVLAGHVWRAL
jgi:hypothetical protein